MRTVFQQPVRNGMALPSGDRLRILHAVFSSRIAGSERYCIDLANRQAALGHEVHVAGCRRSPLAQALAPAVRFHGFVFPLLLPIFFRRLIDGFRIDICHGHLSSACKALGRLAGRHRTVATLHVGYRARQHARLDGLICVNRAQAARLSDYRGLARTIPNWIPATPAPGSAASFRDELGLDASAFLIGAVGRLHPSKGMDVLVSAFRAAALPRGALAILGEGPQRPLLEHLRRGDPRIHLPGFRPSVRGCLADFDLFVSPSREESFGLAILEAMDAGLPIVATAAEGPRELLAGNPVALVPPGSVEALAAALTAAHGRAAGGRLPRVAYDLRRFEPADRLADIQDFYAQVIAAGARRPAEQGLAVAVAT